MYVGIAWVGGSKDHVTGQINIYTNQIHESLYIISAKIHTVSTHLGAHFVPSFHEGLIHVRHRPRPLPHHPRTPGGQITLLCLG